MFRIPRRWPVCALGKWIRSVKDTEVFFCSVRPTNFVKMTFVKWVQVSLAGYTQLFNHHLPERGIRATNALGYFDVPIAERVIVMMVALVRDLRQMIRNQAAAVWDRSVVFQREIRA